MSRRPDAGGNVRRVVPGLVTVVVPTRNSSRTLEASLQSVRAQSHAGVELIVVDNASEDATVELAARWADVVENWGPERSAQRNRGAELGVGEYLVFLDSDLLLEPTVVIEAVELLEGRPDLGALVIPEAAFGVGFWARCRVLEKSLYVGNDRVEAARVFRRDAFEAVGGYDVDLTGGEDWDLPDRVRAAGWGVGRVESFAFHDEGRLRLGETFAKKRYYGRWIPRYLSKSRGVGVRRLARRGLFAKRSVLVHHPLLVLGLIVLKAVEALGLAVGMAGTVLGAPWGVSGNDSQVSPSG